MKHELTFVLALVVSVAACVSIKPSYYSDDNRRAEKAVEQFHDAFNRKAFDEIFEASHPEAKATKGRERLHEVLAQIHEQFGRVIDSSLVRAEVETVAVTERKVEMVYTTRFEKAVRNEMFLVISDDKHARIHSMGWATDEELENASSAK